MNLNTFYKKDEKYYAGEINGVVAFESNIKCNKITNFTVHMETLKLCGYDVTFSQIKEAALEAFSKTKKYDLWTVEI